MRRDPPVLDARLEHISDVRYVVALNKAKVGDEEALLLAVADLQVGHLWVQEVRDALVDRTPRVVNLGERGGHREPCAQLLCITADLPEQPLRRAHDHAVVLLELLPPACLGSAGFADHGVGLAAARLTVGQDSCRVADHCRVQQAGHAALLENLLLCPVIRKARVEGVLAPLVASGAHPDQARVLVLNLAACLLATLQLMREQGPDPHHRSDVR
mmetsp:Transcript_38129/g.106118  ORF Transcript_38129/g.106118 Transcript_38129/m.106118 type:complete len:215 (-) Transcript_38129:39-683(-)